MNKYIINIYSSFFKTLCVSRHSHSFRISFLQKVLLFNSISWKIYQASLLIAFILLSGVVEASDGDWLWAKSTAGSNAEICTGTALDGSGNIYSVGYFNLTADFNPGTAINNLTSSGGWDVFITKYDSSGNYVWAKRIGGTTDDIGNSIAVDALGNIIVTGNFNGTADFDPGSGTYNLTTFGSWDIFIAKLDASGNFIWAKQLGGIDAETPYGLSVDASNSIYVSGSFKATADFDPSASTYNLVSTGAEDVFALKLDGSGNFVWAKQMGASGSDIANAIKVSPSGNVYLLGQFASTVDFNPDAVSVFNLTSIGGTDVFICKLNGAGNFVWAKSFGGISADRATSLATDVNGNIIVTGNYNSTIDFDPGPGTVNLTATGSGVDSYIAKYDSLGNFIWARPLSGTGSEMTQSIITDAVASVYLTGSFDGTIDLDPGATVANFTTTGGTDIFIVKLDESGNYLWANVAGGATQDMPAGIALSGSASLYTSGRYNSVTMSFGSIVITNSSASGTSSDSYFAKLQNSGVPPPVAAITGPLGICSTGGTATLQANTGVNYTYQWQLNGTPISGATANTYVASVVGTYACLISNSCCSVLSNSLTLTSESPAIASISAGGPITFCSGGSVQLNAATSSGYSYQWQLNGGIISGATNSSYVATNGGRYTCVVSNSCGSSASNFIDVVVNAATSISQQPTPAFVCAGSNTSFSVTVAGTNLSYQWKENGVAVANGGVISGATTATLTLTGVPANYDLRQYGCLVQGTCSSATSSSAVLSVGSITGPLLSISGPSTSCAGTLATYTAVPQNAGINPSYQWKVNGGNVGTNSLSYSSNTLLNGDIVTCTITSNDACSHISFTSNPIAIAIVPLPIASISAGGSTTFCSGNSVLLTANTGVNYTYQWKLNGTNISGATTSSRWASQAGDYTCAVTNACGTVVSNTITVTVQPLPTAVISANGPATFCNNPQPVTLTASTGVGYTYQWFGFYAGTITGATGQSYQPAVNSNDEYYARIVAQGCTLNTNRIVVAYFNASPSSATIGISGNQTWLCPGTTSGPYLTSNFPVGCSYQWKLNGNPVSPNCNTNFSTCILPNSIGSYTIDLVNACGTTSSNPVTITQAPVPVLGVLSGNPNSCSSFVTLRITNYSSLPTGTTYQWMKNGVNIQTATTATYNVPDAGDYTCSVNIPGCSASVPSAIRVYSSPNITTNLTQFCTGSATLSANPAGSSYQWKLNGTDIPGATASTYNATASGNYSCFITTPYCSVTTSGLTITAGVVAPVSITSTGNNESYPGSHVFDFCNTSNSLIANVAGQGTYNWYVFPEDGPIGGRLIYSGTSNILPVNSVPGNYYYASGKYKVTLTNSCGISNSGDAFVRSSVQAQHTVKYYGYQSTYCSTGPWLYVRPYMTSNPPFGFDSTLMVNSAIPFWDTYQWTRDGVPIPGATSQDYQPTQSGTYSCNVSNTCATLTDVRSVNIDVQQPPIGTLTGPSTICSGQTITLNVPAVPHTSYLWYRNGDGISTGDTSLVVNQGGSYQVLVTNDCGSVMTNVLVVTMLTGPPASITAAGPLAICSGGSVLLNANTGSGLSYQWMLNGVNINGATTSSYNATSAGNYACTVSNACAILSNNIAITMVAPGTTTFVLKPGPADGMDAILNGPTLLTGNNYGNQVELNANAWGSTTAIQRGLIRMELGAIPPGSVIQQAVLNLFWVPNSSGLGSHYGDNRSYLQRVTSPWNESTVTWNTQPAATTQGQVSIPAFTSSTQDYIIDVTAQVQDMVNNPSANFGWLLRLQTESDYRSLLFASSDHANSSKWPSLAITYAFPTGTSIYSSSPNVVCAGNSVQLNTNTGPGFTYQWQLNGNDIPGATQAVFNASSSGTYTCAITNACGTVISNTIPVSVQPRPSAVISAASWLSICRGSNVRLDAATNQRYSYQWQQDGTVIPGAMQSFYYASTAGNYTCIVSDSCAAETSNVLSVTVVSPVTAVISTNDPLTFCSGSSAKLQANTGNGISYQWQLNGVDISGATATTYDAIAAGTYTCRETDSCGSSTSNSIITSVNTAPAATIQASGSTTFCTGGAVTLNANTGTGLSYQWKLGVNNIGGATASSYNATTAGNYNCVVTNSCGSTASNSITVTVNTTPAATITAAGSTSICSGGSVTLNANTGTGLTYQWKLDVNNITGATSSSYNATAAGNYTCVVTNNCGSSTSNSISVTVNSSPPATITAAGNTTICTSGSVTLNANTGTGLSYQWKRNGTNITGATASSYNATTAGSYTCSVTNSCGTATSNTISVNTVSAPATPSNITGSNKACPSTSGAYSVTAVSGVTYVWTAPANATISAGQGTANATVAFAASFNGGTLTVSASNACGTSSVRTQSIAKNNRCGASPAGPPPSPLNAFKADIYPNPTSAQFTLHIRSLQKESCTLIVRDMAGRVVETKDNIAPGESVEFGLKLAGGIYLAEIMQGEKHCIVRVVKGE